MKQKATDEQTRKTNKNSHRQQYRGYQREKKVGKQKKVKGIKYMLTETDLTFVGEYTMQYRDYVL